MAIPCIHFNGNCNEAIEFYKNALEAEVKSIYYAKDAPADSGTEDLPPHFVMHSEVVIGGVCFSLTDGATKPIAEENISFIMEYQTPEEVTAAYEKLLVGGKIIEPLAKVFWSELYAFVTDQFGVNWQVMVAQK